VSTAESGLVAAELGVRPQNVNPLMRDLTEQGVLDAKTEHRYGTLWRSDEILHAIDPIRRMSRQAKPFPVLIPTSGGDYGKAEPRPRVHRSES
jgi:hypothetical protein